MKMIRTHVKFDWVLISLIYTRFGFVIIWKLVRLKFNIHECEINLIMDKSFIFNKLIWFWKYNFYFSILQLDFLLLFCKRKYYYSFLGILFLENDYVRNAFMEFINSPILWEWFFPYIRSLVSNIYFLKN